MLCKGCGAEISKDHLFCQQCGMKNELENSEPNKKKCTDCGKEFPEERFFCDDCGGKLELIAAIQSGGPIPASGPIPTGGPIPTNGPIPPNGPIPQQGYQQPWKAPNNGQYNQMPPQMPYNYNNASGSTKKKSKALLFILIPVVLFMVFIIGSVIINAISHLNDDQYSDSYESTDVYTDDTTDVSTDDTTEDASNDTTDSSIGDTSDDSTVNSADYYTSYYYSYTELPSDLSLDSDSRFTYYDYSWEDGYFYYQYQFDSSYTYDQYVDALDFYSAMLESSYGYTYQADVSEEQYAESGELTLYLTKGDYAIAITAGENYYATITIIYLGGEEEDNTSSIASDYPNYSTYIDARDTIPYELNQYIYMENGLTFCLNSVYGTDMGDGTMLMEVNMDISTEYTDCYLVNEDFMILPMDSDYNILSDAVSISSIKDISGWDVTTPLLIDNQYYTNYTMSFLVPADTVNYTVYGTNIATSGFAGSLYTTDMTFN